MSILAKYYLREVRDYLGWYPSWPVNSKLALGQIGIFDGREAEFDWQRDLARFGVTMKIKTSPAPLKDIYTSRRASILGFSVDHGTATKADFHFHRKRSIAFQGFDVKLHQVDTGDLADQLAKKYRTIGWNDDWLILTELWVATAFTTLIAETRKTKVSITATMPPLPPGPGFPFNIANAACGLSVSSSHSMSYMQIAENSPGANIFPFFRVHKVVIDPKRGLTLKRYRDRSGWLDRWWPF
jgi:hypothetical protein